MLLSGNVLVRIIEIKAEPLHNADDAGGVGGLELDKGNRSLHENVLHKGQECLHSVETC